MQKEFFRSLGYILASVVALALFSEVISFIVLGTVHFGEPRRGDELRFTPQFVNYSNFDALLVDTYDLPQPMYHPYLSMTLVPAKGETLEILHDGRQTHNPCARSDSLRIWLFGGSTAFGYLVNDNETIASYLSQHLCTAGYSVNVTNYGMHGYQSTQELIKFALKVRTEPTPDLVISYGGFNDVYNTFEYGVVGLPQGYENRKREFNTRDDFNIIRPLVKMSNTFSLLGEITHKSFYPDYKESSDLDVEKTTDEILDSYVKNTQMMQSIGDSYGIKTFFFWQPYIWSKSDTYGAENDIYDKASPLLRELATKAFLELYERKPADPPVILLSEIFNGYPDLVYVDFVHVTAKGNELVAEQIVKEIEPALRR